MLYRSLYFVFCDEHSVRRAISDLKTELALNDDQLHAIVDENNTLHELPGASLHSPTTETLQREKIVWYLTVAVFTTALIGLVLALLVASWYWALLLGAIVCGAQLSGYLFGNRIPNAQLDRFRTGMHQGDIVLRVDAPWRKAGRIKRYLDRHYPGSVSNISNWHVGAIGL